MSTKFLISSLATVLNVFSKEVATCLLACLLNTVWARPIRNWASIILLGKCHYHAELFGYWNLVQGNLLPLPIWRIPYTRHPQVRPIVHEICCVRFVSGKCNLLNGHISFSFFCVCVCVCVTCFSVTTSQSPLLIVYSNIEGHLGSQTYPFVCPHIVVF